jgi:glycosyltransferase involved in cell wall biosynthesis
MERKKLLWLYSEMAGYLFDCIKIARAEMPEYEFHIVRWPLNKEAPFSFGEVEGVTWYDKSDYEGEALATLCMDIQPDQVFCSGWNDKTYINICKRFKTKVPVTLLLDNYWENTLRQHVASLLGPFFTKRHFDSVWVPGELHKKYAKKLGFKYKQVFTQFYCADVARFDKEYQANKELKKTNYPHRFLYVGRYLTLKGVEDLWDAFTLAKNKSKNDWELCMVGAGELFETRNGHPDIKHLGFIQPDELPKIIKDCGAFIMPSHYDHWGVAVHEFAAAGLPLICSEKVGAASQFLIQSENGYLHAIKSPKDLANKMMKMMNQSDSQLATMGEKSNELAATLTYQHWTTTLKNIVQQA